MASTFCNYLQGGYCQHSTGTNGSRQLPCIFKTSDTRIEKCRYQTIDKSMGLKELKPIVMISIG
jgi:hypothetical protein